MRLEALTAVERALGPDHRRVGLIALYAARALTALDRFDEARALLDRALGTYPPASSGAADIRFWRARIALLEGRVDELIREARAGAEIQLAVDDAYEYSRRCAFVMQALAAAHAGDRATTLERIERAQKTAEWNEDSADGEQLLLIAVALALVGETDRSVGEARSGLGRCEKNLGSHHAQTAQLIEHYVSVLERRGARQQAEPFRQALR
jgi:tetratricopeptide (TPR) repeat protein